MKAKHAQRACEMEACRGFRQSQRLPALAEGYARQLGHDKIDGSSAVAEVAMAGSAHERQELSRRWFEPPFCNQIHFLLLHDMLQRYK